MVEFTRTAVRARAVLGLGAFGLSIALLAAPAALADPDPALPTDSGTTAASAATDPSAQAAPVPHLPSPDNLPPGTTAEAPQQNRSLGYLRELWHAIRTQDVTMNDALLLLTQRPLDADASPPPGTSAGPSGPVGSSAAPSTVVTADPATS